MKAMLISGSSGRRITPQKVFAVMTLAAALGGAQVAMAFEPIQTARLERAKDLIAEEQWERAIEHLKAAAADKKERNRDEALFWLAHSQHQARDLAAAVQTISQLERDFPTSRWVKPARSLRIEIAEKLRRHDVLWFTAQPRPAPAAAPAGGGGKVQGAAPRPAPSAATPPPPRVTTGRAAPTPPPSGVPAVVETPRTTTVITSTPSTLWIPEGWDPDPNLRIQALGSLMRTDSERVIPILREIALESPDPNEASRAIFMLAQSGRPEAHATVLDVARRGTETVQIAAVKELGRFGGPKVSEELLRVYTSSSPRVKYQIVNSLGDRAARTTLVRLVDTAADRRLNEARLVSEQSATTALLRIAESESDRRLQETAVVRLGQAGAREQLQRIYTRARPELRRPIIVGLFNARADDELIAIAEKERDQAIRTEALTRLRLLGTPKARAYIEKVAQNR